MISELYGSTAMEWSVV